MRVSPFFVCNDLYNNKNNILIIYDIFITSWVNNGSITVGLTVEPITLDPIRFLVH